MSDTDIEAGWFKPCGRCYGDEGCLTAFRDATVDVKVVGEGLYYPNGTTPQMQAAVGRFARCMAERGLQPQPEIRAEGMF